MLNGLRNGDDDDDDDEDDDIMSWRKCKMIQCDKTKPMKREFFELEVILVPLWARYNWNPL